GIVRPSALALCCWSSVSAMSTGRRTSRSSQEEMYRRAAGLVAKILQKGKAREVPVERPTKFELVLNLKTANTLGARSNTSRASRSQGIAAGTDDSASD